MQPSPMSLVCAGSLPMATCALFVRKKHRIACLALATAEQQYIGTRRDGLNAATTPTPR